MTALFQQLPSVDKFLKTEKKIIRIVVYFSDNSYEEFNHWFYLLSIFQLSDFFYLCGGFYPSIICL